MNAGDHLRRLVEWYEKNSPDQGQTLAVHVKRKTMINYGFKPWIRGGPLFYKGRRIVTHEERFSEDRTL